jgi:MFS transporter, ENTS family, enterobactin (siderophore) exporter
MPADPAALTSGTEPLGRNRDFRVLLGTQGVSAIGDAVSFTALPLLVFALTGSGLAMGVVGALQSLPDLFFGMVAGALADRADRKRMMFIADLGRGALTALIPLTVLLGGPTLLVILLVAAPMSVLRSFFLAAYTASVPNLVGRSELARANSIFEAVYSTGYIVGPAIAGFLAATIGPGPTLAIDAASFVLSSLGLFLVRRELRAPVDRPRAHLLTEIREGIDFILGQPVLRTAILFFGLTSIILTPLVAALTVHITRDLHLSPSVLGLILTAYGAGTVIGSLFLARIGDRGPVARMLVGGNVITGVCLIVVARVDAIPALLALSAVAGFAQAIMFVTYLTMRTAYSPDALLGRVGSTARTISLGLQPVGLLTGGALIDLTSGSATIAGMGALVIVVSLAFLAIASFRTATLRPGVR